MIFQTWNLRKEQTPKFLALTTMSNCQSRGVGIHLTNVHVRNRNGSSRVWLWSGRSSSSYPDSPIKRAHMQSITANSDLGARPREWIPSICYGPIRSILIHSNCPKIFWMAWITKWTELVANLPDPIPLTLPQCWCGRRSPAGFEQFQREREGGGAPPPATDPSFMWIETDQFCYRFQKNVTHNSQENQITGQDNMRFLPLSACFNYYFPANKHHTTHRFVRLNASM